MNKIYWVLADLHGEFDKLMLCIEQMKLNGFNLDESNQYLVQLGDRNDRGPDTYKINEYFKQLQSIYSDRVIVLNGNHEMFMLDATDHQSDLMWYNGGNKTEQSYSKVTHIYGRHGFGNSLKQSGHYEWLRSLPFYHETEEYFFSHAPIPKAIYAEHHPDMDFRLSHHTLIWSFVPGVPETEWVEPNLIPIAEDGVFQGKFKICCAGHVHSGQYNKITKEYFTPNPRRIGHTILLDSGAGCWKDAVVSAIRLSDMLVVQSNGNSFILKGE